MNVFEALMLVGAGLFAGGALTFAWSRAPIWRSMPLPYFLEDFAQTLRLTDKVQPALLLTGAASAAVFAATSDGAAALLAAAGAAGLLLALVGSVAVLVPLQRRLIAIGAANGETIAEMRARWLRGNLGRSILATVSFALIAAASAV
jgi:hypothetical protein